MRIFNDSLYTIETAQTINGTAQQLNHIYAWSATEAITVTTPAAKNFVDADVSVAADTITITSHGFKTGLKGQLTTTGVLPGGLSLSTDYFVIVVNANTIKLATTLNNANAGTPVDITSAAGGGTHTFTATSLAGATLTWQACNDTNGATTDTWVTLASPASQAITTTASYLVNVPDIAYKWVRPVITLTAGQLSVVIKMNGKGV